jgi:hypothetical protein
MATLGQYLREAREALGMDVREAAQMTRINIAYLKALEADDFKKLPGEVFVKGFLKSYAKFLRLDEAEVVKRYAETQQPKQPVAAQPAASPTPRTSVSEKHPEPPAAVTTSSRFNPEPYLWAAGLTLIIVSFLFASLPKHHAEKHRAEPALPAAGEIVSAAAPTAAKDRMYLEVVALESTWFLVRIDDGPQKKAMLKKGESLIWSADERFLVSYGSAVAVKLMLNGQELVPTEQKNAVVRDLAIGRTGILKKAAAPEREQRKEKPASKSAAKPAKPRSAATATAAVAPAASPAKPAVSATPSAAPAVSVSPPVPVLAPQ